MSGLLGEFKSGTVLGEEESVPVMLPGGLELGLSELPGEVEPGAVILLGELELGLSE